VVIDFLFRRTAFLPGILKALILRPRPSMFSNSPNSLGVFPRSSGYHGEFFPGSSSRCSGTGEGPPIGVWVVFTIISRSSDSACPGFVASLESFIRQAKASIKVVGVVWQNAIPY